MKYMEMIYEGQTKESLEAILKHNRKLVYIIRLEKKEKKRTPAELNYLELVEGWYNSVIDGIVEHLKTKDEKDEN